MLFLDNSCFSKETLFLSSILLSTAKFFNTANLVDMSLNNSLEYWKPSAEKFFKGDTALTISFEIILISCKFSSFGMISKFPQILHISIASLLMSLTLLLSLFSISVIKSFIISISFSRVIFFW